MELQIKTKKNWLIFVGSIFSLHVCIYILETKYPWITYFSHIVCHMYDCSHVTLLCHFTECSFRTRTSPDQEKAKSGSLVIKTSWTLVNGVSPVVNVIVGTFMLCRILFWIVDGHVRRFLTKISEHVNSALLLDWNHASVFMTCGLIQKASKYKELLSWLNSRKPEFSWQ